MHETITKFFLFGLYEDFLNYYKLLIFFTLVLKSPIKNITFHIYEYILKYLRTSIKRFMYNHL